MRLKQELVIEAGGIGELDTTNAYVYFVNFENPFVDVSEESYYYGVVEWCYLNGITSGKDATHFNPQDPCNRAQVTSFIYRAYGM